jgi:hypothetical protein
LGEQDDTRLASIAHGVSGYFVAVGGLGYFFAARRATLPTEPGSAPISRSSADPLACKDLRREAVSASPGPDGVRWVVSDDRPYRDSNPVAELTSE